MRYPKVKRTNNLSVSRRTINRTANNHGIRTFRCIKRPIVNLKNQKQRYQLAKILLRRPFLLDKIVFTDEKKFANSNSKIEYVNRLSGTAYKEGHKTVNKIGSSAADLNVWGYVGSFGKGEIFVAENIKTHDENGSKLPGVSSSDIKLNKVFNNDSYLNLLELERFRRFIGNK